MDRDKIVRDDFPTVRKGYDPDAVREHLRAVADAASEHSRTPLAEAAADRVAGIVEAAERKAAEIEKEARDEAERIVEAARDEAKEQVDRAQRAVKRLIDQADDLRSAIGKLGSEIVSQGAGRAEGQPAAETTEPEIVPEPARVPEPEPPRQPEPEPPREPEPQPPPSPEPEPAIVPEPQPPGPEMSTGSPSTEDLLAQLRGDAPSSREGTGDGDESRSAKANGDDSGATTASPAGRDADVASARLVAMKMALDGASRGEIERHLAENYELANADALLDEVLARAKP